MSVSLDQQAELAELKVIEWGNHVDNLRFLQKSGKRTPESVREAADRLPIHQAQAKTLRALADNQDAQAVIRDLLRGAR